MKITKYDSDLLIEFYNNNALDFDKNNMFYGKDIKSYALLDNDKVVGALSFSKYRDVNYIEAIAIASTYRKRGYGKMLLDKAINELSLPVYLVSKNNEFFLKYGFCYDDIDLISNKYKLCKKYNTSCFPKVMSYIKKDVI